MEPKPAQNDVPNGLVCFSLSTALGEGTPIERRKEKRKEEEKLFQCTAEEYRAENLQRARLRTRKSYIWALLNSGTGNGAFQLARLFEYGGL